MPAATARRHARPADISARRVCGPLRAQAPQAGRAGLTADTSILAAVAKLATASPMSLPAPVRVAARDRSPGGEQLLAIIDQRTLDNVIAAVRNRPCA